MVGLFASTECFRCVGSGVKQANPFGVEPGDHSLDGQNHRLERRQAAVTRCDHCPEAVFHVVLVGVQQRFLAVEVMEERAPGDAGRLGYRVQRGGIEPLFQEQAQPRIGDPSTGLPTLAGAPTVTGMLWRR